MIDAHRIAPRLWQGSRPREGHELRAIGVDVLVLCALEYQPPARSFPSVHVIHAPLDDSKIVPVQMAARAARQAAYWRSQGKRVLVTCNMGRNRSGLVTALILWYCHFGTGQRCAEQVKRYRPDALTNPYFANWLAMLPKR